MRDRHCRRSHTGSAPAMIPRLAAGLWLGRRSVVRPVPPRSSRPAVRPAARWKTDAAGRHTGFPRTGLSPAMTTRQNAEELKEAQEGKRLMPCLQHEPSDGGSIWAYRPCLRGVCRSSKPPAAIHRKVIGVTPIAKVPPKDRKSRGGPPTPALPVPSFKERRQFCNYRRGQVLPLGQWRQLSPKGIIPLR
jgi:hypothetical protein